MLRQLSTLSLLAIFAAAPVMVGCEKTLSERKTTETNRDGTVTTETEKTVRNPDGTVKKTETEKRE